MHAPQLRRGIPRRRSQIEVLQMLVVTQRGHRGDRIVGADRNPDEIAQAPNTKATRVNVYASCMFGLCLTR